MFKTIKAKTILMQTTMMLIMMGIVFVLFTVFFDDYYFARKMRHIERAYNYLTETDIADLKYADKVLVRYRDQNFKFLITDENFKDIFEKEKKSQSTAPDTDKPKPDGPAKTNARINRYIVKKVNDYNEELTLKNTKFRICGYGIITQNNHKYYVYIYETKSKMKIGFSYNKIFLLITLALAVVAGIAGSIWISGRISKPIKQIEEVTETAPEAGYDVQIEEKQKFRELSGLAKSINVMMEQIRDQMQTLEEEIEHKNLVEEQRRQFVNNVSHEMKTPLAIISSQVEMLSLIDDEEKREEYCRSIIEETENMSEMLNDMIVVYSSQNEGESIALEETDVCELAREVSGKYDDLFARNQLMFHQEYGINCFAKVNRRYLAQAIDNYITNSVKHSDEQGNIYLSVTNNDNYVRIEVENEGPNIPEEYKDKIWDMFFQGEDGETLNGHRGSGLGLYLVKSIVELHQGNYGFKNLDHGIIFWMELPKA